MRYVCFLWQLLNYCALFRHVLKCGKQLSALSCLFVCQSASLSVLNNLDPTGQNLSSQTRETVLCEVHAGANKRNVWPADSILLATI
jgi:hypothetical protein